jgi:hypothetical protein
LKLWSVRMFRHMNGLTQFTGYRPSHTIAAAIKPPREVGAPAMATRSWEPKPPEFEIKHPR